MPTKLKGLRITRVDLVDKGANFDPSTGEGSHVLLAKRAQPGRPALGEPPVEEGDGPEDAADGSGGRLRKWFEDMRSKVRKAMDTFQDRRDLSGLRSVAMEIQDGLADMAISLDKAVWDVEEGQDPEALLQKNLQEFEAWFNDHKDAWLSGQVAKGAGTEPDDTAEEPTMNKPSQEKDTFDRESLSEEAQAAFSELEKRAEDAEERTAELEARLEKLEDQTGDEPAGDEDIFKGVHPKVRERLEKAEQRAERAEKAAAQEREQRLNREYLAKAKKLPAVPGEPQAVAKMLRQVDENLDEEVAKQVNDALGRMNQAVLSSDLLKSSGTPGSGEPGSALEEVNKRAKKMVEDGQAETHAQAVTKVCEADSELYARYQEEKRAN